MAIRRRLIQHRWEKRAQFPKTYWHQHSAPYKLIIAGDAQLLVAARAGRRSGRIAPGAQGRRDGRPLGLEHDPSQREATEKTVFLRFSAAAVWRSMSIQTDGSSWNMARLLLVLIAEVEGGDANKFRLLCSGWPTASWSSLRRAWCSRRTTSVPSLRGVWGCTDGQVFFDFFFSRQCSLWWEIFQLIGFFCQILRVVQTKRFLYPPLSFFLNCPSESFPVAGHISYSQTTSNLRGTGPRSAIA